jgi:hypothetical protein
MFFRNSIVTIISPNEVVGIIANRHFLFLPSQETYLKSKSIKSILELEILIGFQNNLLTINLRNYSLLSKYEILLKNKC